MFTAAISRRESARHSAVLAFISCSSLAACRSSITVCRDRPSISSMDSPGFFGIGFLRVRRDGGTRVTQDARKRFHRASERMGPLYQSAPVVRRKRNAHGCRGSSLGGVGSEIKAGQRAPHLRHCSTITPLACSSPCIASTRSLRQCGQVRSGIYKVYKLNRNREKRSPSENTDRGCQRQNYLREDPPSTASAANGRSIVKTQPWPGRLRI